MLNKNGYVSTSRFIDCSLDTSKNSRKSKYSILKDKAITTWKELDSKESILADIPLMFVTWGFIACVWVIACLLTPSSL